MAGITAQLGHQFVFVHFHPGLFGDFGPDRAQPVALVHAADALFNHQNFCAQSGGVGGGHQARIACTHHKNFSLQGLGNFRLGNLRRLAQPVGVAAHRDFLLNADVAPFNDGAAAGLRNTVGHCGLHGFAGVGGAGHAVDGAALGAENLLRQFVGRCCADICGLSAGIHHHIGDAGLVKGHGDRHLAVIPLGGSSIGARRINGLRSAGRPGGSAAGIAAPSQRHRGASPQGARDCLFQKAAAINLAHSLLSFSSWFENPGQRLQNAARPI